MLHEIEALSDIEENVMEEQFTSPKSSRRAMVSKRSTMDPGHTTDIKQPRDDIGETLERREQLLIFVERKLSLQRSNAKTALGAYNSDIDDEGSDEETQRVRTTITQDVKRKVRRPRKNEL